MYIFSSQKKKKKKSMYSIKDNVTLYKLKFSLSNYYFFFLLRAKPCSFFFPFFFFFRETSYVVIIMINHTLCWGPEIRDLIGPGVVQLEAQKHNLKSLWITHLDPFTKISNPALMVVQLLTRPSGLAYTWLWFGSHGPYFADSTRHQMESFRGEYIEL